MLFGVCETWGWFHIFSKPQFPHMSCEDNIFYLMVLCAGVSQIWHLVACLADKICFVSAIYRHRLHLPEELQLSPRGLLARYNYGQVGFAGFSVSSSQDFMLQREGVTSHAFLRGFYFHGYYKYSLLGMQYTHLIPFCPEKN